MANDNRVNHLTPEELADRFRVTVATLASYRVKGVGPGFIKVGRAVRYPLAEVERFEAEALRSNTAENAATRARPNKKS